MALATDFLQSLVPISQFNKGQAAKIFDRLHSEKELIVLKNNLPRHSISASSASNSSSLLIPR